MTTPSGATPGGGDGKKGGRSRMNNIIPVFIKDLLEFDGETFTVEGLEAGMVVVVGQVKSIDNQATKATYRIEDNTGAIDAVLWVDENKEPNSDVSESIYVRVVGGIRTNNDKKYILAYKISPTSGAAENDGHMLDVVYARYKIKQLKEKEDLAIGAGKRWRCWAVQLDDGWFRRRCHGQQFINGWRRWWRRRRRRRWPVLREREARPCLQNGVFMHAR